MPPRKGSQKVKTGCRTCKTRKVKCDEGKPACHRCTVAGRVCGGYESAAEQGLSWYRPRQLTAYDEREGRAFHFFTRMVGPVLSGPMDAYFWTHLVMQFSHFQPAVRHAVYAISSLYEDFHRGQRLVRHRQSNVFAIGHYTAAIQEIKSANDEQLMMLLCVLFICIEYLQGDPVAAMRHCQYGIHILNKSGCSPWVREHLLPLFRRLSSSPFLLGGRVISVPGLDVIGYDSPTPKSFTNLAEAESTLDYLVHQAIALVRASQGEDHYRQGDLEAQLIEWHRVLTELEATLPPSTENQLAICTMRMRYEIVKIRVNMAFEHAETMYDNHLDDFQYVVDLARQAAQLKTELGVGLPSSPGVELAADPKPSFIFESGFLPLLYCVAIRCRKLDTRMEALDLMARLSVAKENIFDVGSLYRVGRRLIEFEHGIDLADRAAVQMAMSAPLPAEERRVTDVALDHEPEVRTDEMTGRTTYRRRFWFMLRDPVTGEIQGLEQHVSDELPPHMGVVVPSIRCAIPA